MTDHLLQQQQKMRYPAPPKTMAPNKPVVTGGDGSDELLGERPSLRAEGANKTIGTELSQRFTEADGAAIAVTSSTTALLQGEDCDGAAGNAGKHSVGGNEVPSEITTEAEGEVTMPVLMRVPRTQRLCHATGLCTTLLPQRLPPGMGEKRNYRQYSEKHLPALPQHVLEDKNQGEFK